MLQISSHISDRGREIKNFEEDRIAVLQANPGLKFIVCKKDLFKFQGKFYVTDERESVIDWFDIAIVFNKKYPYIFPLLFELSEKIERNDSNHIDKNGSICLEFPYIINSIEKSKIRVYDFVNHYVKKYFMWILLKKASNTDSLKEWSHKEDGKIEFYQELLGSKDNFFIKNFLTAYCSSKKHSRNLYCYCGIDKKLKFCHMPAVQMLNDTDTNEIYKDIELFK
jgi:hypothetical protein